MPMVNQKGIEGLFSALQCRLHEEHAMGPLQVQFQLWSLGGAGGRSWYQSMSLWLVFIFGAAICC